MDCNRAINCLNETVALSCKATNCFLVWTITGNPSQKIMFTCFDASGITRTNGLFTANLTSKHEGDYDLISELYFKAIPALQGRVILCQDGVDGSNLSCTLTPMSNLKLACIIPKCNLL